MSDPAGPRGRCSQQALADRVRPLNTHELHLPRHQPASGPPDRRPPAARPCALSTPWRASLTLAGSVGFECRISSGTAAAAAADVLPSPAQRAVHSLFGTWGVPAPRSSHGAKTVPPSTPAVGTAATDMPGTATGVTGTATGATIAAQQGATRRGVAPPSASMCSGADQHGAGAHCGNSTAAAPAPAVTTPGAGHATKTGERGSTASARSGAGR
jgi:hypothetical protein